jgi:hypothetical protein
MKELAESSVHLLGGCLEGDSLITELSILRTVGTD